MKTLRTTCLVRVTLCKANGAIGANFFVVTDNVFKFARCAIGTFGAAVFGGTAKSTLVAWNLSIFVSGKSIFRAKLAFNSTYGIVEFTLQIKQRGTRRETSEKKVINICVVIRVPEAKKKSILVTNETYRNAGQTRTLTNVVTVVTGWAMSAGDRNRITAVAVFTFGTRLAPIAVCPRTTGLAFGTASA